MSMGGVCPICYDNGYMWLGSELCLCPIGQEIQDLIYKRQDTAEGTKMLAYSMYSFVGEPDLNRIIEETIADNAGQPPDCLLITSEKSGLFLLSSDFLGRFDRSDDVSVYNRPLNIEWGLRHFAVIKGKGGFLFRSCYPSDVKGLQGYQGFEISASLLKTGLGQVVNELNEARSWKRNQKINVHIL